LISNNIKIKGGINMEDKEIKKMIADYLTSHNTLTLATVTPENKPLAHTVEYASEGTTVYIATSNSRRKVQNILKNPHVAYTVDEDYKDWLTIKGVQMEGIATVLSRKEDIDHAAGVYLGKFPFVAQFPPNPEMVFIKIKPTEGSFLDYTKGFTHSDAVTF
jgi:uncharacterized protein YhbP (UPF0306 family)